MDEPPQQASPLERARRRASRRRRAYVVVAAVVVALAAAATTAVLRRHATHARTEAACPGQIWVSAATLHTRTVSGPVTLSIQPGERCDGAAYGVTLRSVRSGGVTVISRPRVVFTHP